MIIVVVGIVVWVGSFVNLIVAEWRLRQAENLNSNTLDNLMDSYKGRDWSSMEDMWPEQGVDDDTSHRF